MSSVAKSDTAGPDGIMISYAHVTLAGKKEVQKNVLLKR